MRKILSTLAILAILFASCTQNDPIEQPKTRTLHVVTTVTGPSDTRLTAKDNGGTIRFSWEVNDVIHMAFVQGKVQKNTTATVKSISDDGRTAYFDVVVPEQITGDFTLYAYRGFELKTNQPTAVLQSYPGEFAKNLAEQQKLVSVWAKQDIAYDPNATTEPTVKLPFKHIGAMMTLKIKNKNTSGNVVFGGLLISSNTNTYWVANGNKYGRASFKMDTETFDIAAEGYELTFGINPNQIAPGEVQTYYHWFAPYHKPANDDDADTASMSNIKPYSGENTPEAPNPLVLKVVDNPEAWMPKVLGTSAPKNAIDFQPGKNYVVYVTVEGTSPNYTVKYSNANWE